MIILIDGPEKTGKSTLIAELAKVLNATVRHWGPVDPDDRVYTPMLKSDSQSNKWFIWDRGWPSEHVYGKLLHRDRRLVDDPFLGEWLHGRAVQTAGLRVILLPSSVEMLRKLRNSTDLKVDPTDEYEAFYRYGHTYGYTMLCNYYNESSLEDNIDSIVSRLGTAGIVTPPFYAGPVNARVVFVGEKRNVDARVIPPGSWLPFSSRLTSELGRRMGPNALKCGWTNVGDVSPEFLANRYVVACGEVAADWLRHTGNVRLVIPHPAWLYRYNTLTTQQKRDLVDNLLSTLGELK